MSREKIEISESELENIKKLASLGFSIKSIAASLGISESTLKRRRNENEAIDLSIKQGKLSGSLKVASKAFEMACSGKYPQMTMWWLKHQAGFEESKTKNENCEIHISIDDFEL